VKRHSERLDESAGFIRNLWRQAMATMFRNDGFLAETSVSIESDIDRRTTQLVSSLMTMSTLPAGIDRIHCYAITNSHRTYLGPNLEHFPRELVSNYKRN
jgi:hypothetical protein